MGAQLSCAPEYSTTQLEKQPRTGDDYIVGRNITLYAEWKRRTTVVVCLEYSPHKSKRRGVIVTFQRFFSKVYLQEIKKQEKSMGAEAQIILCAYVSLQLEEANCRNSHFEGNAQHEVKQDFFFFFPERFRLKIFHISNRSGQMDS